MEQNITEISLAVSTIKKAILKAQYHAARGVNGVQLSLYYAIGQYVHNNVYGKAWGTNAIGTISRQLQRELPGLHGFGERQIRNMMKFYTEWRHSLFLQPSAAKSTTGEEAADFAVALLQPSAAKIDINEFLSLIDELKKLL